MPAFIRSRDGATVTEAEAMAGGVIRDGYGRILGDGEAARFSMMLMDSRHVTDAAFLTDASGKPVRLVDRDTGAPVQLNHDLIEAMKAEAKRLGLPLQRYVGEVLRYAQSHANLSGGEAHAA